jgi:hypothetical protein
VTRTEQSVSLRARCPKTRQRYFISATVAKSAAGVSSLQNGGQPLRPVDRRADKRPTDDAKKQRSKETRKRERSELIARLEDELADDLVEPLARCGDPFMLTCTCCGEEKETEIRCKKRWCPVCAWEISAKRYARWGHAIAQLQWPLFVTLTVPNTPNPESLRRLRKSWGKFRRRKLIREKVKGGVAGFEVTNKGNGWHPHIHAVMDCRWLSLHVPEPYRLDTAATVKEKCRLAQLEVSALWADQIDEPGAVVWISRVYGDNVAAEVLKYAAKGSDLIASPEPIAPMLRVMAGTRMLSGWGCLHPLPSPDEDEESGVTCQSCGSEKSFLPNDVVAYLTGPIGSMNLGRTVPPSMQD